MANKLTTSNGLNLQVGMTFDTNSARHRLDTALNQLQKTAKIQTEVYIDNERFVKTVRTYQDAMKNLVEETTLYNGAGKIMSSTITNLTSASERIEKKLALQAKATQQVSYAQQNLNTHVAKSKTLFSDFIGTFAKMAKFNTINLIYDGIISKMSEAIQVTNDFDAAMTEFKKVTDTTNLSLSDYTEQLGELGEATARSATQMLEASTEFSKSGYDANTSAQLAQTATLFQNIADSEVSAGDAASFIISQMKAYGIEANNAVSILDKVNETSNSFAVSSTDITSALTKQSASLAAYGNSLDESIALVTAGTEIMTGQAGKVARGLRTIGANITQLAQNAKEFEITVNGATKTIQLWNETGTDMLNTYDVLKQISAEWDNMTNAEKSSLAVDLAKKTQMDTFLAVLGNFEDAEKAYVTALTSEGSAWEENAAYMESIEAHQAKLKAAWETLILSKPFEDLEKSLLNAGTALLNFANSDIGKTITKVTALVAVVGLLNSGIRASITRLGEFIIAQYGYNTAVSWGTVATDLFTKAILANPIFWGVAAVAGIVAITKAIDALIVTYDEQIEKLNASIEAYENAQNEVKNLESQLKSLKEAQDLIADKKVQITDPEQLSQLQQQSNELERQRAILERQLVIAKAKADEAERQAKADAQATLGKKTSTKVSTEGYGTFEYKGTPQEVFQQEINSMRRLQAQIIENNKTLDELKENEVENSKEIEVLTKRNNTLTEHFNNLQAEATKTAEELGNVADTLGDVNVEVNGHKELLSSLLNTFADFVGWDREATDANSTLTNSFNEENDELENTVENIEDVSDAYAEFFDKLEDIQSAYETLSKAAEEYNTNGFITASTLKKLNKIAPEYLVALKNEGGQYSVNIEKLKELYKAEQDDAVEKLELAKNSALCKLANEYLTEATDDVTTAVTNSGNEAKTAAPKYEELAKSAGDAAIKMREVHEYLVGGEGDDSGRWEKFKKEWDETSNWFDQQIENVKKSNIGLADSSSKAAKSSKDAWVEAFEEEQRQLKHSLEMNEITEIEYYEKLKALNEKYFGEISGKHQKYIKEYQENEEEIYKGTKAVYDKVKDYLKEAVENGYEKAINALEKEEKKILNEIKKQIDALKKEKSNVLDGIKDEIDALKRQKDAVQDYYNKQIDVIKKENDVLQEQNELLEYQQALQQAKAQKVMVMQDGKFQLGENESAVAQAEQNLSNYQDQLSYEQQIQQLEDLRDAQVESIEARIASLEEYYDYMEDYYDKQIESMELYYDQVQEQYELQIEALQAELDAFKEGYQKSEDLENAKLAASVLAANEEAAVWQTRLENLANAVTEYNKLLSMIGEEGAVASSGFKFTEASYNPSSSVGGIDSNIQTRASGDASFKNDEIALVGESPNTELILGSRLNKSVNSGVLTHLSKGSGIVNAESTQTLAGLLNGLASPTSVSNARSTQQTFNFGAITLPNVTNAESFVGVLRDKFNNYSIQYSTIKK